jgi:O-antigen/teichoic acid export membrane protein
VSRRLAVDIVWLWVGYVGRSVSYLGITILLSRALGSADYGQLSLFLAFALGISYIAGSWPFLAVPILVGQDRPLGPVVRTAALLAAAGTALAFLLALPLYAETASEAATSVVGLAVFSLALVGLQGVYGVLQTTGQMRDIALVQAGERTLALLVLLGIVAVSSLTVLGAQLTLVLAAAAACTFTSAWLIRAHRLIGDSLTRVPLREVISSVGPMAIVGACSYGVAWVDIFLISAFKPDADVGVYSLAYQIYTFALQVGSLWIVATLPRHARASHGGQAIEAQVPEGQLLAGSQLWAGAVGLGALLGAIAVPAIFGADFEPSIVPLLALLAGATTLAPYFAVVSPLIGAGGSRLMAAIGLVGVGANVALDLLLIPAIGIVAPAVITALITAAAAAFLVWRALGPGTLLRVSSRVVPAALAIAVLAADPQSLGLRSLTGIVSLLLCVGAVRTIVGRGMLSVGSAEAASPVIEPPQI